MTFSYFKLSLIIIGYPKYISSNYDEQKDLMNIQQNNDPLHGVTLEQILTRLVDFYGWEYLGITIKIRCFNSNPSVKSCLKFLRKTPWARTKVENLYTSRDWNKKHGS